MVANLCYCSSARSHEESVEFHGHGRMLCPSCGTRNVATAMTCVVCAAALLRRPSVAGAAPKDRPEILRAPRPSPLAPPDLDGLPASIPNPRAVASPSVASPSVASPSVASPSVASPSVASPSVASPAAMVAPDKAKADAHHSDVAPANDAAPRSPAPVAQRPVAQRAATLKSAPSERPPPVQMSLASPPSADPAPAPSRIPARPRTNEVIGGAAPLSRVALAMVVDGVVAFAPAVVMASLLAPPAVADAGILESMIEALLLTPACTVVLITAASVLHTLHLTFMVPRFGATLGGSIVALGLRDTSGALPTVWRAGWRGLVGAITSFVFLAGPLFALIIDADRRTLGDVLGGTRPVRHRLGGEA